MQEVHKPSEGQFYVCYEDAVHAIDVNRPDGDSPVLLPRKVTPLRAAKVQSTRSFFLSLNSQQKVEFLKQLPAAEKKVLWSSFTSSEKTHNLTYFALAGINRRPDWLPAVYVSIV